MEWWCILLTAKHGNTLTVCIITFQLNQEMCLGLCTDGFNPFRSFVAPYSCWSIILTVYNLPPEMCMRPEFMFLSTVIPGPSSLGRNIDVCLRLDWWVGAVVVLRSFDLWYIEETKFCYEVGFDVDYHWFSSLWNAFWLEHAWETRMSIHTAWKTTRHSR